MEMRRYNCFNPRAHAGRDFLCSFLYLTMSCFNPRAHAGRDSISGMIRLVVFCFNPRAHAGRDAMPAVVKHAKLSFNPRAHAGRDLGFQAGYFILVIVSIHAPMRGATFTIHSITPVRRWFQSTRPCGARQKPRGLARDSRWFQSTRPCGARLGFQSGYFALIIVSIHAPMRGATVAKR